jgi:hypothetical protein
MIPKVNLFQTFQTRFVLRSLLGRIYQPGNVTITKAGEEPQNPQQDSPGTPP